MTTRAEDALSVAGEDAHDETRGARGTRAKRQT